MENNQEPRYGKLLCNFLKIYWRMIFAFIWPLIWLPVLLHDPYQAKYRCMYITLIIGGYWIAEPVPLGVTSMIPMAFFPSLGILDANQVCTAYFHPVTVMFTGGLILACAIEYSNLHVRIAMITLMVIGCSPKKLTFGLSLMTMFISMWISNTAATAMMIPIIFAVLRELEKQNLGSVYETPENLDAVSVVSKSTKEIEIPNRPSENTIGYFLLAAYASSIGGIGSLIGTGTNLTFKGLYEGSAKPDDPITQITFGDWMFFCVPLMLASTFFVWLSIQVLYFGMFRPDSKAGQLARLGTDGEDVVREVIKTKYKDLGGLTFHEGMVGILFFFAIMLWFFRSPGFMDGWADRIMSIGHKKIADSDVATFVIILMFLVPAHPTFIYAFSKDENLRPRIASGALLSWKFVHEKVPWNLMFLLGSGFAISKAGKESGMSRHLGELVKDAVEGLPPLLILLIVCVVASLITDMASNVAVANLLIPVVLELSRIINIHNMYLSMPVAICCSFAFMLPVGTPPNALVFECCNLPKVEMAKAGLAAHFITIGLIMLLWPTIGALIYGF